MVEKALVLRPQASLQASPPTALPHASCSPATPSYFHILFLYFYREGEERRNGEEERETLIDLGSKAQPRYMPRPGIKPVNFWFTGRCSNQLSHTGYHFYSSCAIVPACPTVRNTPPPYLLTHFIHSFRPSSSVISSVRSSPIH